KKRIESRDSVSAQQSRPVGNDRRRDRHVQLFGEPVGAGAGAGRRSGDDRKLSAKAQLSSCSAAEHSHARRAKGKVLGVTRYGTVNDATMRLLLNKLGVDPERDVRLIQVGDSAPVVATSLIAGKTFDGALLQPPYYNKAVEAGMRVFANMEEMDIPFQQVGLNTTQKYIVKNSDVVRRVVKSIVEGVQLIRANPAVSKRAIARYMKIKDEKVLEDSYQQLKGTAEVKPYPSAE